MNATKQEMIEKLRRDLLDWEGFRPLAPEEQPFFGLGPIEQAFPNRVFPTGALHEFISTRPEFTAAIGGFIAGVLQTLLEKGGVCVWVSYTRRIYPPALKRFGISPDRIIFIDVAREKDVLWVTEEALKCSGIAAVICETRLLSFMESRRLQLAIEQSRVTGFILRKDAKILNTTACTARWTVKPLRSRLRPGMPGVGYPRWQVELLKVKNGQPGSWILEWKNNSFLHPQQEQMVQPDTQRHYA
ncbi:Error-prone repair protein ImuA [Mucilaginibacter corticis]|uniref:Error-prone repair protein ImuA n=1 Tax=Mucilaginibacter corticis TaxID=2597670 RepID=A0A556MWV4_9SPHI|nr:Error-prone repair protein ImuA [Mucilaginibacter corticis]TSJ44414.1 Error-prone repair protein ImuA [Mucilaginibacter corticis]